MSNRTRHCAEHAGAHAAILRPRHPGHLRLGKRKACVCRPFYSGRYWARTSDLQLVEFALGLDSKRRRKTKGLDKRDPGIRRTTRLARFGHKMLTRLLTRGGRAPARDSPTAFRPAHGATGSSTVSGSTAWRSRHGLPHRQPARSVRMACGEPSGRTRRSGSLCQV